MNIKLIHGDCLEVMPTIESKSVDMILCDLPYGTTACKWDTIIPLDEMWKEYYRVLRPNGFIVLTASQPFTSKLISSNIDNFSHQWIWEKVGSNGNPLLANMMPLKNFEDVLVFSNEYKNYDYDFKHPLREYFRNVLDFIGLNLKQINQKLGHTKAEHTFYVSPKKAIIDLVGQKADHVFRNGSTQFSLCTENTYNELISFFSIDKMEGFLDWQHLNLVDIEFKQSLLPPQRIYNPQKTEGKAYSMKQGRLGEAFGGSKQAVITESTGQRFPKSIISFPFDKEKLHPTQKPVALFEYLIKTYTNEGDLVLDNCAGSFTTAEACFNTNRKAICIEKELKYYEIGVERMRKVKEKQGLFANNY